MSLRLCSYCRARPAYAGDECFWMSKEGRCGGSRMANAYALPSSPGAPFQCLDCRETFVGESRVAVIAGLGCCDECYERRVAETLALFEERVSPPPLSARVKPKGDRS